MFYISFNNFLFYIIIFIILIIPIIFLIYLIEFFLKNLIIKLFIMYMYLWTCESKKYI